MFEATLPIEVAAVVETVDKLNNEIDQQNYTENMSYCKQSMAQWEFNSTYWEIKKMVSEWWMMLPFDFFSYEK